MNKNELKHDQGNSFYMSDTNDKKVKRYKRRTLLIIEAIVICILVVGYIVFITNRNRGGVNNSQSTNQGQTNTTGNNNPEGNNAGGTGTDNNDTEQEPDENDGQVTEEEENAQKMDEFLAEADLLAMSYDYESAIGRIKEFGDNYAEYDKLTEAIAGYEEKMAELDPFGAYDSPDEISHVFFHILVADTAKAFDGDYDSNGYNYYMTTTSEFNEMMQQMYDAGYVLVSIHDVAKKTTLEDGTVKYVPGDIMLPKDKKPFVISQDDVNYYEYMTGDGFATRVVLDENGKPKNEMLMDDGTVSVGDYDMIPLLDAFIEKHPDFSYKGAKGLIALTGYEGSLGYRTNDSTSPTFEEDKATVKKIAQAMKEQGWEFASHSYGHRDMGKATYSFTKKDSDRWMEEVGSLIGPTDVYIFPYGIDIETTMGLYESDKYEYLKGLGFDYFCGVYSKPWIHIKDDYVRMTRRPLDGQAMLQFPERLKDLFDVNSVVESIRPALK